MFLPESMSRIVIVGNKNRIDETTDVLFKIGVVHLVDHTNGSDDGFAIGAPRPYASKASERMVSLKATEKELGIDLKHDAEGFVSYKDIGAKITEGGIEDIQSEVMAAIDEKNKIVQKITDLEAQEASLELLSVLGIDLELYRGYESIEAIVGTVTKDPSEALEDLDNAEYFVNFGEVPSGKKSKKVGVAAVFIKKEDKDKALSILSEFEFSEITVPEITGSPAEANSKTKGELIEAKSQLEQDEIKIASLKEKYKTFIVASDEVLTDAIKRGDLPLSIATSEYSFVIDGWIPTMSTTKVEKALADALGDSVYVEVQEIRGRTEYEEERAEPRFKTAPTKWKNGAYGKHFEYPVSLLSAPKYNEIDPSAIIGLFFPFFFGFMVGDVGYAIPFICLGAYGLRHAKSKDFQAIATVLFFGGIWALLFGFFFFGEMLGMHFVGTVNPGDTAVTWEYLLSVNLPDWFTGIYPHGHGISKLGETTFLLKLSVYMGLVHLGLAYLIKFANVHMRSGFKEAYLEAGGWFISFVGMAVTCYALTCGMFYGGNLWIGDATPDAICLIVGIVILIIGVISCWPKEKAQAILELPGIVGNILSYTRLAAIGMSKAGMALAFNYIAILMLAPLGIGGFIGGLFVFAIGHLMIWVLAILSAGLHGLRLQYVEMMNKFFIGNGEEYSPLKTKFKHVKKVETEA